MSASSPVQLTPSGIRAIASTMVSGAVPTTPAHTATTVVDAVDMLSRALLVDLLGLTPLEARQVLAVLWTVQ